MVATSQSYWIFNRHNLSACKIGTWSKLRILREKGTRQSGASLAKFRQPNFQNHITKTRRPMCARFHGV